MKYYDTDEIHNLIKHAFEGDEEARTAIKAITAPYAVAKDYSQMILIQEKHASIDDKGLVRVFNLPPKEGRARKCMADIYRCDEESSSWSNIPIPFSFVVHSMNYNDGVFSFISNDSRTVAGTLIQISRAMFEVAFAVNGVSEAEIEKCFFNIPSTVVEPCPPKKTVVKNLPITDDILGVLTFDERMQWFEANYQIDKYSFELYVNTDSRDEALKLLPAIHGVLSNLEVIDLKARGFAADELLELKNDNWLEEDEELLTKDDFISRMSIETISFEDDGEIQIWYADGDLFWGHSITVHINGSGELERAEING